MIDFIKHLIWSTQRNFIDWKKKDKNYIFNHNGMDVTIFNDISKGTYTVSTVITVSTEKQITDIDLEYKPIKELFDLLND